MPNTPILALPYPAATDPVSGGAAAIQALATGVEGVDAVIYSRKLTANGNVLSIPAATFPSKFAAIEIGACLFQAAGAATSDRTSWGWRPLPAVGTIAYGIACNPGTGSPGAGQAASAGAAVISSFLAHASARQNTLMAFFHAILYGPAEGRAHFLTFDWFSLSDFSGTPANDYGNGTGRAHIVPDNVRVQPAITGFEVFASAGAGFGIDSAIWARGLGARSAGIT